MSEDQRMHLLERVEGSVVSHFRGTLAFARTHGLKVLGLADSLDHDEVHVADEAAAAGVAAPAAVKKEEAKLVTSTVKK